VFERFTERARQVVVLAQEEARTLCHSYIGTEHILLGLLREQRGLAARVLEHLDVSAERVRGRVVAIVGSGQETPTGQIPFTPRAKKALELALREALSLGHDYIGTEHILLGLVRENEGVAARILLEFDAGPERIRREVLVLLGGRGGAAVLTIEAYEEESWLPSLGWDEARIVFEPDAELQVPLRLERRALELLERSEVWRSGPLAGLSHENRRGVLRITGASLLNTIDPHQLRLALDDAVREAHEAAALARSREAVLAETFLARLRAAPPAPEEG
jgi:ATP-dependent Clp protease ATP-binding subunit ClpA